MGIGGIGIWQLLIVLLIIVLLFGTKKLRNIGTDLGGAIKSFRASMKDGARGNEAKDGEDEDKDKGKESGRLSDMPDEGLDPGDIAAGEAAGVKKSEATQQKRDV